MSETFLIFFQTGATTLETAATELAQQGFDVRPSGQQLRVQRDGSPEFTIEISCSIDILHEARAIGAGTEHEAALGDCASRFEVTVSDLDAALDEINTMMELQGVLQDLGRGYLYLPWNDTLTEPWSE